MSVAETIRTTLEGTFAPVRLSVVDESHQHAGHIGHRPGGGTHFRVELVSAAFAGKSRVERQRLVYAALGDLMKSQIHALALTVKAPEE